MTSQTITALGTSIINLINRKTPIATASTVGMVKPDGNTISIDDNGVISSISSTGVEKFDGPWVSCNEYQIFSNVGLSSSTYSEYTLDFLPDNGVFELNCMYMVNSGANNGYARLVLNDESESYRFVVGVNTGVPQNAFAYGQVNLIVSNKKVKAMKVGGGNGNEKFSLTAVAYRKLGTGFKAI